MTVQISSLRVAPDFDASKYAAGAGQKIAADKAMIAGNNALAASSAAVDTRIEVNGDLLSRLSGRYVSGSKEIQQFTRDLGGLGRALETGKMSMEGAERIIVGMGHRLGLMADASELAARGQHVLAAAVERANSQIARQQNLPSPANSNRRPAASFNTSNLAAQGFDIAATASVMPFYSVALQQGPQVAQVFNDIRASGQSIGPAVAGAFAQILNPVSLLTIGVIALTAATVQWVAKGRDGAVSIDEALKGQSDTLRLLKQQYGEAGEAAKRAGTIGGVSFTEAQARSQIAVLQSAIKSQSGDLSRSLMGGGFFRGGLFGSDTAGLDDLLGVRGSAFQPAIERLLVSIRSGQDGLQAFDRDLNSLFDTLRLRSSEPAKLAEEMERLSAAAYDAFAVKAEYAPFQAEIDRLLVGLKEGNGEISTFADNVRRIGDLNGMRKVADDIILSARSTVELATRLREIQDIMRQIDRENTRPGLADQRSLNRYVDQRSVDVDAIDRQFAADQQFAKARTNAERLIAIENQVRARAREDGDSEGGLQARLARARQAELNRQNMEARDAAEQRARSLAQSIDQQMLEINLIGRTTGEAAKMRFEAERMQELREEARRTGGFVDPKEEAAIRAAADAMGKYADAAERIRLVDELRFEREQLARTEIERTIADKMRFMGNDPALAADIRRTEELKKQVQLWEDIRGKGMDAMSSIFDLAFDPTNWKQRLSDLMSSGAKMLFDYGTKNPFLNNMYPGADLPTLDKMGGLKGLLGTFFGMTPNPAAGQNVGAMTVQAASVFINGAPIGNGFSPGFMQGAGGLPEMAGKGGASSASSVSRLFSPANLNTPGGPLEFLGRYKAGVDPRLTDILEQASLRFPGYDVKASSGFRPGDPRFHGKGLATDVQLWKDGKFLDNYQNATTFRDYEKFAQTARAVQMEKYPELADRFRWGGYFSGGRGKYGANDPMHFDLGGDRLGMAGGSWAGGLTDAQRKLWPGIESFGMGDMANKATLASQALDKLALKSTDAGDGLGSLLNNLFGGGGKGAPVMPAMAGAFPPAPAAPGGAAGGGGFLQWLLSLMGFADGTESAPAGWAWVGERGPELRKLRAGDVIRSNPRSMQMASDASRASVTVLNTVHNNAGVAVRQERSEDPEGNVRIDTYLDEKVAKMVNKRGSATGKALGRTYGARRRAISR